MIKEEIQLLDAIEKALTEIVGDKYVVSLGINDAIVRWENENVHHVHGASRLEALKMLHGSLRADLEKRRNDSIAAMEILDACKL